MCSPVSTTHQWPTRCCRQQSLSEESDRNIVWRVSYVTKNVHWFCGKNQYVCVLLSFIPFILPVSDTFPHFPIPFKCKGTSKQQHNHVLHLHHILRTRIAFHLFTCHEFKPPIHPSITPISISGSPWLVPGHHGEDKHNRDIEYLNSYADKQWEVGVMACCVDMKMNSF